jgi:hypothetical protein
MHTNLLWEIWEEDFIRSHVWAIDPDTSGTDYEALRPPKRYTMFDYLRMLLKLLPYGYIWRFPIGEPGDY